MLIELAGAPGAGKTTLLPAMMDSCRALGLRPYTMVDAARAFTARTVLGKVAVRLLPSSLERAAIWGTFRGLRIVYATFFAFKNPRLAWYVATSQRGRPAEADARQRRVLHWYIRFMGSYEFFSSRSRDDEVIILDEGFVHRAVQLHASSVEVPDPTQIDSYVGLIPRPDLVIHLHTSIEVCEQRVRARGAWKRFDRKHPEDLHRFIANAHRASELVVASAKRSGWPIVQVQNSASSLTETRAELMRGVAAGLGR
jgi:thymidylate kinase